MKKKVVVAMSGGVDSSVAAALLKEQGYDVTGMMMRLWSEPGKEESNRCCTPDSMAQARRVAGILDIPFYVTDAKEVFRETVVQYFLDGYAEGGTPNPCLICNRQIRWTFLLNHALALGAEFMATGHYVRIRDAEGGIRNLFRAVDSSKDQSYVLHVLGQEQLKHALFPVGEYPKSEIRAIAERYGLPTASRKDSQDLCFLAGEDYRNFLRRNAPEMLKAGNIETLEGKVVGEHNGLANYTIGQRKGLGVVSPVPLYVITKNAERNALIVGTLEEMGSGELTAVSVNWISGEAPPEPFRAKVKIRYTAKEVPAWVRPMDGGQVKVAFDAPVRDATKGQAAVFYEGEKMLGGGIIQ
ncbi:MAG: tRNA 2-thiouridine(34) synthase MnmA [Chloroflexi bacterium CFX1]|nr:tRNA 2-thiouridine(34) synthase MnmA [Chloroflexi bacterium CFX1]MCQ3954428.1 tRNA 2-thiouridine(34) synthase MnmA [Chloroflexota bacterium]MDL1920128.1 tRNA 2-thiouridine(34) synthase MnmA [Chloroflexi bacterium CFX5]NUQ59395.1 tRNA 2-thiouridine(34) synthase MnmA [Anaerolineales bacterium]